MKAKLFAVAALVAASLPVAAVEYEFSTPKQYTESGFPYDHGTFSGTLTIDGNSFSIHASNGAFAGIIPENQSVSHDIFGDFCVFLGINFAAHTVWASDVASFPEWSAYDVPYHEVSAVPEPGTWALMLGGLVAIGALRQRRAA